MGRQFLEPVADASVEDVVGRLGALQAQSEDATELSIYLRRRSFERADVADAFRDGRLIRTFAFRGATHLMTVQMAAIFLTLRASSKVWERPAWQEFYKLKPSDWPAFRQTVRDALADGPLTRQELGRRVTANARYSHLSFVFTDDNWTLLKPLTWMGDMAFGSPMGGRATFQRLDSNPRWTGLLDVDEAGIEAVRAYLSAYGPATVGHLNYWLGNGLSAGRKKVSSWILRLGDAIAQVDVQGESALVLAEHVDELAAARETRTVRMLPAYDQWMIGPGTADDRVTPRSWRSAVTRGSNVVIVGGVVCGTWKVKGELVIVDALDDSWSMPRDEIDREIGRTGRILGKALVLDG